MLRPHQRTGGLSLLILGAATLLAYLPVAEAGFIWDDDDYVSANPVLRSGDGLRRIWLEPTSLPQYYPLVHTTYWLEYRLWGLDPRGFHLVNVLLHAASAALLFLVLRSLDVPGAFLGAALFALHPVQVESVAWITERKNVLSGLLYLAALRIWIAWRPPGGSPGAGRGGRGLYAAALACFALALLSKTVACSLPAVILILAWWKRGRIGRRDLLPTLPFFALGLLLALPTLILERDHVGAVGTAWDLSWVERLLVAGRAVWFYAAKLLWPVSLSFNYPRWELDPASLDQVAFPVGVAAVFLTLWFCRRSWGRGPLAAALVFGGNLLPALGFFNLYPMRYAFVADHFQYLASMGFLALVGALAARGASRLEPRLARYASASAALLLALLGILTWRQASTYRDPETLWEHTLRQNSSSWLALTGLGKIRADQDRPEEALALLREAVRREPSSHEAHNNLGVILLRQGAASQARDSFEEALRLKPDYAEAHNNLACALWASSEEAEALVHLDRALAIAPSYLEARRNRADVLLKGSKPEAALPDLEILVASSPEAPGPRIDLSRALAHLRRYPEALRHLELVVALDPRHVAARVLAATSLRALGRWDQALAQLVRVLVLEPEHGGARTLLVATVADAAQGGGPEAPAELLLRFCRLIPSQAPKLLEELAAELSRQGRTEEAAAVRRLALE